MLLRNFDADLSRRGGIRGIVELMILTRLIEEIGFSIPIQQLFDLVIGTSTGRYDWKIGMIPVLTMIQAV